MTRSFRTPLAGGAFALLSLVLLLPSSPTLPPVASGLEVGATTRHRRAFLASLASSSAATVTAGAALLLAAPPSPAFAQDDVGAADGNGGTTTRKIYEYESRDRKNNAGALIREDYWYMNGKLPPRRLEASLKGNDPKFNAFGSCESDVKGDSNPCTYVSLKQRVPAYKKYGGAIQYGIKEMQVLGDLLRNDIARNPANAALWEKAGYYVSTPDGGKQSSMPPPIVDAELKMVLLATALTTSPNFPLPSRELLVARFYANECHFASGEMAAAVRDRDVDRAIQAWEFGKDSWNSYAKVVNRSISEKVGDKFDPIV